MGKRRKNQKAIKARRREERLEQERRRAVVQTYSKAVREGANALLQDDRLGQQIASGDYEVASTLVKKISRMRHIKVIALAYALFVLAEKDENVKGFIGARLEGKKISKKTTLLHALLSSLIIYGEKDSSGLRSRDYKAIQHLMEKDIAPNAVVALYKQRGEGLDTWARSKKGVSIKRSTAKNDARNPAPGQQMISDESRALVHRPFDEEEDDDGTTSDVDTIGASGLYREPVPLQADRANFAELERPGKLALVWEGNILLTQDISRPVTLDRIRSEFASMVVRLKRQIF